MTANPWRGETEIAIGRKTYILRPTFTVLSHIEQRLNTGIVALAEKLAEGKMTLHDLAVIIAIAARPAVTENTIRRTLLRGDSASMAQAVAVMMSQALTGEVDYERR